MQRWLLLMVLALAPALLLGQSTVNSGWANTPPPVAPGVAPGTPLVTTPIVHLGSVSTSSVGATNATAGNVAGATNATMSSGPPVMNVVQSPSQAVSPSEYSASPTASEPGSISTRLNIFDRGAAQFDSVYNISTPSDISVGQVAREWRQRKAATNARTFTNEDINRIEQQYGPPGGGMSSTAVSAGSATSGSETTAPAAAQPPSSVGAAPSPAETRSAPTAPPTAPAPAQSTPLPQSTAPPPPETMVRSETPAQEAATQEPAERGAAPGEAQQTLPAAGSQIPTVLLLGGAAVLAGVLLRRRNHRRSGIGF